MSTITTVSHVRILNELETQALEMAIAANPLGTESEITLTIGKVNQAPFVAVHRKGKQELLIKFEQEHHVDQSSARGINIQKAKA